MYTFIILYHTDYVDDKLALEYIQVSALQHPESFAKRTVYYYYYVNNKQYTIEQHHDQYPHALTIVITEGYSIRVYNRYIPLYYLSLAELTFGPFASLDTKCSKTSFSLSVRSQTHTCDNYVLYEYNVFNRSYVKNNNQNCLNSDILPHVYAISLIEPQSINTYNINNDNNNNILKNNKEKPNQSLHTNHTDDNVYELSLCSYNPSIGTPCSDPTTMYLLFDDDIQLSYDVIVTDNDNSPLYNIINKSIKSVVDEQAKKELSWNYIDDVPCNNIQWV